MAGRFKKIRFIQSFSSERESFVQHREYELPEEEAQQFIDGGIARDISPPAPDAAVRDDDAKPDHPRKARK